MSQIAFSEIAYDALISDYFNKITNNNFLKKNYSWKLVEKLDMVKIPIKKVQYTLRIIL